LPADRDDALRRAEKLLRQGRLDAAVAEYARLVEQHPADLATANALGDLYVRAGAPDRAIPLFMRVADAHLREGFYARAAGFYKKILKLRPAEEAALLGLAEACLAQRLVVDARACLATVADLRRRRQDVGGLADVLIRLADLDPQDVEAALDAARALARRDPAQAAQRLREQAARLVDRGQAAHAVQLLAEVTAIDPADRDSRVLLARLALDLDDLELARRALPHQSVGDDGPLLALLAECELRSGLFDLARETLLRWLRVDAAAPPAIAALGARLVSRSADAGYLCTEALVNLAMAGGDVAAAWRVLQAFLDHAPAHLPALLRAVEVAVDGGLDAELVSVQTALVDAYLAAGHAQEARVVAEDLLARDPDDERHRERLRRVLVQCGDPDPDGTLAACLQPLLGIDEETGPRAAGAPDAGSEWTVQEGPQDAAASAARADGGEPGRAHGHGALAGLAVPGEGSSDDEDAAVRTLAGDEDEEGIDEDEDAGDEEDYGGEDDYEGEPEEEPEDDEEGGEAVGVELEETWEEREGALAGGAADGDAAAVGGVQVLDDVDPARRAGRVEEVDLTELLNRIAVAPGPGPGPRPAGGDATSGASAGGPTEVAELEAALDRVRDAALRDLRVHGWEHLAVARTYQAGGMVEEAIEAFEQAYREPTCRFEAALALADLHESRGRPRQAVDWLERAAEEAGADAIRLPVLYRLAALLEQVGETARALAVWLELQAASPGFRDVAARAARLGTLETGGGPFTR
jgi:tetratricopeptide (TPR) repeat protein